MNLRRNVLIVALALIAVTILAVSLEPSTPAPAPSQSEPPAEISLDWLYWRPVLSIRTDGGRSHQKDFTLALDGGWQATGFSGLRILRPADLPGAAATSDVRDGIPRFVLEQRSFSEGATVAQAIIEDERPLISLPGFASLTELAGQPLPSRPTDTVVVWTWQTDDPERGKLVTVRAEVVRDEVMVHETSGDGRPEAVLVLEVTTPEYRPIVFPSNAQLMLRLLTAVQPV